MTTANRPLRIGLTGGIASGKTTVADLFAARGIPVIDTDQIARDVVEPGQPALEAVVAAFGREVLGGDGRLDRRRLRALVFADPDKRRQLESILHPAIRAEMVRRSLATDGAYQVLVIPLLAEGGGNPFLDRVLVVDCSSETQLRRLLARDAESEDRARAILAAQVSRERRLAMADDVITNDGTAADLAPQVEALDRKYRTLNPA